MLPNAPRIPRFPPARPLASPPPTPFWKVYFLRTEFATWIISLNSERKEEREKNKGNKKRMKKKKVKTEIETLEEERGLRLG